MGHLALIRLALILLLAGLSPHAPVDPIDDVEYVAEQRGALTLEAPAGSERLARAALAVHDEARPIVEEALGVPASRGEVRITIAPHRQEFQRLVREATLGGEAPHQALAVAIPSQMRIVILGESLRPLTDNSLATTMRHELVHRALARGADGRPLRVARWLDEGLAEHVGGRTLAPRLRAALRGAAESGRLPALETLAARFPRDGEATFAYAQSLSFVSYIRDRFGDEALRGIVGRLAARAPLETAWRAETGVSLEDCERDWREALRSDTGWLRDWLVDPRHFWEALFVALAFLVVVAGLLRGVRKRRLLRKMDLEDDHG